MSPNSDSHEPDQTSGAFGNLKTIDLEFETLRQFREAMASRLNYEGFFVATNDPLPKGTPVRFRFLLADGFVLVEGTAVVAWARYEDGGPDQRYGMALLFNELGHQGREIIDELIDFHIATGGDPFEIGPGFSDPGDIGIDALASDPLETKVPLPELVFDPDPKEDGDKEPENILPDWLSEVAQKHDIDLGSDATIPVAKIQEDFLGSELPGPVQQDFEISLMPEGDDLDPTPAFAGGGVLPEITVRPPEKLEAFKDLRLRPLLAVVAVLVAAAAVVWWIANRGPGGTLPEPAVVVEEIPATERPVDVDEERAEEPVGKPPEVTEAAPESPQIQEMQGPATRVLQVAASRSGDETVVAVRANGELSPDSVRVSRIKDPARVWVRIQGIETFYRPNDIEVGTPEVERVRVGHHPEETPQSLYVVLDLEDSAVVVREHTIKGDTLRVVVGRP
jgi:hypothetical protein